jgi:hypothetical protein
MIKDTDPLTDFDFGFSFVDEEYEEVIETQTQLQRENLTSKEQIEDLQKRIDLLYNSITPFLNNLCKNPEKSTILWPNRVEKIEQYKRRLEQIVKGNIE